MKILLGVDDSPHSRAALDYVKQAKWPAGTQAVVVSVARPAVGAYTEVYAPGGALNDSMLEEQVRYHQELASKAEQELQGSGLETEARVLSGDPREVLVEAARAVRADLVVVGSHGRSGLAKLLMGSVAAHVVAHAPCNVMVVKLAAEAK
ncbi:MAG: hypothetical protein A2W00_07665 [Candidatus Eisenbacteria bacterium RBG_16_71_46]|nr:MAG: hypothetical protein A2W00_07665 [Candidatus Eisenbacteria bacterium RBG_16_71_46]OGF24744.1 MAG: hypothetical protein A2V63_04730 [Candidatus Eisenbacteria bacterium RBG_19FT_COMBO_70_11]